MTKRSQQTLGDWTTHSVKNCIINENKIVLSQPLEKLVNISFPLPSLHQSFQEEFSEGNTNPKFFIEIGSLGFALANQSRVKSKDKENSCFHEELWEFYKKIFKGEDEFIAEVVDPTLDYMSHLVVLKKLKKTNKKKDKEDEFEIIAGASFSIQSEKCMLLYLAVSQNDQNGGLFCKKGLGTLLLMTIQNICEEVSSGVSKNIFCQVHAKQSTDEKSDPRIFYYKNYFKIVEDTPKNKKN